MIFLYTRVRGILLETTTYVFTWLERVRVAFDENGKTKHLRQIKSYSRIENKTKTNTYYKGSTLYR